MTATRARRLRLSAAAVALLLTLCAAGTLAGQETVVDPLDLVLQQMQRERALRDSTGEHASVPSPLDVVRLADSASAARYLAALTEYHTWGLSHRQAVFRWQLSSSRVIFVAVLFLVLVGVSFSGVQFYKSMRLLGGKGGGGTPDSTTSHLELSAGRVKISSPVLGVIILVISLAFFYLYLIYVYPISETF